MGGFSPPLCMAFLHWALGVGWVGYNGKNMPRTVHIIVIYLFCILIGFREQVGTFQAAQMELSRCLDHDHAEAEPALVRLPQGKDHISELC